MRADMFSVLLFVLYYAFRATVVAQSSLSIVCVAGQCLRGFSNTTIGATLSASGGTPKMQLLPGQYSTSTDPQLLHDLLTSRSSTLVGSIGFQSASLSLPLNLQLEPGLALYSDLLYSGQVSFAKVPDAPVGNTSIPLSANSIAISPNVWITIFNNNRRLILWDSVPDVSQLPSTGSLSLLDIQSSSCASPCSGPGFCSASGTCTCPTGFTGSSCESCEDGFFGPTCEKCPADCPNCDQGISGSGRCLKTTNNTSGCNCLNGQCGAGGTCTCNNGWTTADNGTACAKCIPGFYLSARGCEACGVGCSQCDDDSGLCKTCRTGFTIDTNNRTKCTTATTSGGTCSDGFFGDGSQCSKCSTACRTCTGPTANDCTLCAPGTYFFNGNCVSTDNDGVCQGSNGMVGNRDKNTCDSCDAKCVSCKIPNFITGADQQQCTRCLPGSFLVQGKCVDSCSSGMFASQNGTCTSCSSSCSSCAGSPDFCLTCPSGQVASSGRCISACPSDTFLLSGTCIKCHPDCSTCSGPSFNQCNSCPTSRPVLTGGRCLFTCPKPQYFDTSTSTCQACDSSCSSCSGPGSQSCLACSSPTQILRSGSCVSANCPGNVVPGLGACLSALVQVPPSPSGSGSGSPSPLPTITGLADPTSTTSTDPSINLTWWQILLMTLGITFIFLMLIWCWRRRAKRRREDRTKSFWLVRLGRRLFGRKKDDWQPDLEYPRDSFDSPKIPPIEHDILSSQLAPPRPEMKERSTAKRDSVDDLISSYEDSPKPVDGRRKKDNPRRLKGRIDRNSHSLYTGKHDRREALQEDPPPLPTKLQFNSEGVIVNRFNQTHQGQKKAVRPTIDGDTGASSLGHPMPTYAAPPVSQRPVGPSPSSGAVPQHPGGGRMPVMMTGNRQGPPYMLPAVQTVPQFHLPQPPHTMVSQPMASYSNAPPHNPFRPRGH